MESNYNRFFSISYPGFKVGKCLEYITENSLEKSQNKSSQYIKKALKEGGLSVADSPQIPIEYNNYLKNINFILIKTINNADELSEYIALPGDIAIMYTPTGDKGHICIFNGYNWVSDFIQNSIRPYTSLGVNPFTIWIWRWNGYGWIEKNSIEN